jgi:hypothetical protein
MNKLRSFLGCLVLSAGVFATVPAFADIPPRDSCRGVGTECNTAGPNADEPGTCERSECSRQTPDGVMTYECERCVVRSSGGGGAAGEAGSAGSSSEAHGGSAPTRGSGTVPNAGKGGSADAGTGGAVHSNTGGSVGVSTGGTTSQAGAGGSGKPNDDGGCSVSHWRDEDGLLSAMCALGLAGLFVGRRRR